MNYFRAAQQCVRTGWTSGCLADGLTDGVRRLLDDDQQRAGGPVRRGPALLPLPQGAEVETEPPGELRLAEMHALPQLPHVDVDRFRHRAASDRWHGLRRARAC